MRIPTTILALAAAILAMPAIANENAQISVKYSDLDLSTRQGQATLNSRIDQAALALCGRGISTGTILSSGRAKQCYERARASAHQMIAERTGRSANSG
ncbi:MAG: UrcA family protein [Croceibacterium sp.]